MGLDVPVDSSISELRPQSIECQPVILNGMPATVCTGDPTPVWPRRLDWLILLGLAGVCLVELTGGFFSRPFGIRVSIRSPTRVLFWVAVLAGIRHYVWRRPTTLERLEMRGWLRRDAPPESPREPIGSLETAGVITFFVGLVIAALHDQVRAPFSVPDFGDPLFSTWRLAWVARTLFTDPLNLFQANIFHPEPDTLAYSDAMILPSVLAAPFMWAGAPKIAVYQVFLFTALMASGVTLYFFVRRLTGNRLAGLLSGSIFALYPYRFEHYSHLELQMTMWMPVGLLLLQRVAHSGGPRLAVALGIVLGLQTLSCLYYGVFFPVYLAFVFAGLTISHTVRPSRRRLRDLAIAGIVAVLFTAPLVPPYLRNRSHIGERDEGVNRFYSAKPADYLAPNARSTTYAPRLPNGEPERCLFPGITPVLLTAVALFPPLTTVPATYAVALLLSVDASLGFNGVLYPFLYDLVLPFRGLRVPARFSVLVGLSLAILAGVGLARLGSRLSRRGATGLVIVAVVLVYVEYRPSLALQPVRREMPSVYTPLAGRSETVVAVFPMAKAQSDNDALYMYFSTWHWQRLVNGYSGNFPASYEDLLERMQDFPSPDAIAALKQRGVRFIVLHGELFDAAHYDAVTPVLDRHADLELIGTFPGTPRPSRLYRFRTG
jgi:hypothetical protein